MGTPLDLSPDDYWGDFTRTKDQFRKFVSDTGFTGIRIDGPPLVALERRESAPVVGYYVRTLRDDLEVNAERQMLAAAFDLSTKRLRVGLALDTGKTPEAQPPPAGLDPGEGLTFNAFSSDLRIQVDLPWEKRKHLVAFALRETLSNPVVVELGSSPTAYRDPAVEAFLAEQRKNAPIVPPRPITPEAMPEWGVTYARVSRSPEVPKEPGIALSLDPVSVARRGSNCLCFGSFRLPVNVSELVRPDTKSGDLPDVGDPQAKAIVPISLLLTGSASPGPWVIDLRVPTYDAIPAPKGAPPPDAVSGIATGHFALDLFAHPAMPRQPMTYFVTAFGGASVSGPFQTAIVTEKMLRDAGVEPT
jgi:hypothetical protein